MPGLEFFLDLFQDHFEFVENKLLLKRIPDEDNPIVLAAAKVIIDEKGFPSGKTCHQYDNVLWNIGVG
jgi:hypothetical protein